MYPVTLWFQTHSTGLSFTAAGGMLSYLFDTRFKGDFSTHLYSIVGGCCNWEVDQVSI
jgi:hypothetical protein